MLEEFTDDELAAEAVRARKLERVCREHGMADGYNAMAAVAEACEREAARRALGH